MTHDQLIDHLMDRLGSRPVKTHIPLGVSVLITQLVQAHSKAPIVFMDQVLAQKGPVICDIDPARRDLASGPILFCDRLSGYYPETVHKACEHAGHGSDSANAVPSIF